MSHTAYSPQHHETARLNAFIYLRIATLCKPFTFTTFRKTPGYGVPIFNANFFNNLHMILKFTGILRRTAIFVSNTLLTTNGGLPDVPAFWRKNCNGDPRYAANS
jgi:hypothetical protein